MSLRKPMIGGSALLQCWLLLLACSPLACCRFVLVLSDDKGYFWVLYLIYVGIVVIQVSPYPAVMLAAH